MGIKVCSLFDGCSGTQMALKNLGVEVDQYFSSEIDKYAMQVTQKNFPETIQLGDITDIKGKDLPKIDLIVGGSPCQGFSFAGKQKAFKDERSALFFEFIRLLKEIKPKYFLLENVVMKKEFQQVITDEVSKIYPQSSNGSLFGIEPIMINSALLSAQNRKRLYWTNIPNVEQPEDLGIVLKDVLETCSTKSKFTYNTPKKVGMNIEEVKVRKHEVDIKGLQFLLRSMKEQSGKTNKQIATEIDMPVTKVEHWFRTDTSFAIPGDDIWFKLKDILGIETDVFDKQIMEFEYRDGVYETKQRVYSENGKSPTLTSSNKEQYIETYNTPKQVGIAKDINGHDSLKRVYSENGKSPTVNAHGGGNTEPKVAVTSSIQGGAVRGRPKGKKYIQKLETRSDDKSNALTTARKDSVVVEDELTWRKLTPLECERLQTLPDNYTEGVSNTQRYKMIGNGFTIKVIEHILGNMDL